MYKDKEKQKEAERERSRRYRLKLKGVTEGVTKPGRDGKGVTRFEDLPADVQRTIDRLSSNPEEKAQRTAIAIDYQHQHPTPHSKGLSVGHIDLPEGYKTADQLAPGEYNKVSKPGDPDYEAGEGQCQSCGKTTQIKAITKCHQCVEAV